jgi:hypothetical protein
MAILPTGEGATGGIRVTGGGHRTNLERIMGGANRILARFMEDDSKAVLRSARMFNKSRRVRVSIRKAGKYEWLNSADGPAAEILAWGIKFRVPSGGFKPPAGKKAFAMEKPEGIVFRSRTYTRQSGRWIRREGFFDKAINAEILSMKGKRRAQSMISRYTYHVANEVARSLESQLAELGVEVHVVMTSGGFG